MKRISSFFLFTFFFLTVFAQDPCDEISFPSIGYSPFTETVIALQVQNNSSTGLNLPGFILINSDGDTVAMEGPGFFVLATESWHTLNVREGVQNPLEDFDGRLELHTGYYDTLWCTWPINQSLCLEGSCDSLIIGLENYGGALVVGDFEWDVKDETGSEIESGQFTMTAQNQSWRHGLCLPSGNYTYTLNSLTGPSGGGPTLTVSNSRSYSSPTMSTPLDWFNNPSGEIEFPFFTFCSESPSGVIDQNSNSELPAIAFNTETGELNCTEPMSETRLYSTLGKLIVSLSVNSKTLLVPNLPAGTYIAVGSTQKGDIRTKFMLK